MRDGHKGIGATGSVKRDYYLFTIPALTIIALDQVSKCIVLRTIPLHGFVSVIGGFFNLVHTRNRGMAFGLMNRPGNQLGLILLVGATLAALAIILFWFFKLKEQDRRFILPLSFILAGAVGNLIDRVRLGEVIDFLDFYMGSCHWPAFNIADSAITIGTFWLAILMLFPSRKARQQNQPRKARQ